MSFLSFSWARIANVINQNGPLLDDQLFEIVVARMIPNRLARVEIEIIEFVLFEIVDGFPTSWQRCFHALSRDPHEFGLLEQNKQIRVNVKENLYYYWIQNRKTNLVGLNANVLGILNDIFLGRLRVLVVEILDDYLIVSRKHDDWKLVVFYCQKDIICIVLCVGLMTIIRLLLLSE